MKDAVFIEACLPCLSRLKITEFVAAKSQDKDFFVLLYTRGRI